MKQEMYYFYGAGSNCTGALYFFGPENVKGIADNNPQKIGDRMCGVPIISIDELLKLRENEWIIITAFLFAQEIIKQLKQFGITRYYVCPYMSTGYLTAAQMVEKWKLLSYREVCFLGAEPVKMRLFTEIGVHGTDIALTDKISDTPDSVIIVMKEYERALCGRKISNAEVIYYEKEIEIGCKKEYHEIKKYRNIHSGKSCIFVGNGPSLTVDDLELIKKKGMVSFGCNRIDMVFNRTSWRPDYYVSVSPRVIEDNRENIEKFDMTCFLCDKFDKPAFKNKHVIPFRKRVEDFSEGEPRFSEDISECIYACGNVMYCIMQIAVYMGFTRIYLLGVDFTSGENGRNTHFYYLEKDDNWSRDGGYSKENERKGYLSAKRYADSHGIKIYNATRGGRLEVFERISFDRLMSERQPEK